MLILGLKLARYREWWRVIAKERPKASKKSQISAIIGTANLIILHFWKHDVQWRRTRFSRLRRCYRCPIFDRQLKRCRPYDGSPLGCGCYMPIAAGVKEHGWLHEQGPSDAASLFCW
jgi:Fe-S-cluster containining protein